MVFVVLAALWVVACGSAAAREDARTSAGASSGERISPAAGPLDGDRFSLAPISFWQGPKGATSWWWQVEFRQAERIGAILQVVGDHDFVFRNAPRRYVWQWSEDGLRWRDWTETAVANENRLYRVHRLRRDRTVRAVRLQIEAATGDAPTLREVEFFKDRDAVVPFPDWLVTVNTTHEPALPGHGQEFIPLARSCAGWERAPAQQIWVNDFDLAFVNVEPRPRCAFLSGNFKDWCEVDRRWWQGTERILKRRELPMWASCGGAQALALLATYGTGQPWDCPHCRDPLHPKTPLYTHLGHTVAGPCGDYSGCLFERGPHWIQTVTADPVFRGLPGEIQLMESHCGQIQWVPKGWQLVATAGQGTQTKIQCLRLQGAPIYAAQFHVEMAGTPQTSQRIMANFLELARQHPQTGPAGRAPR
ncbi:MAG TPA: discoidin domain-containing protein [Verrucomicrobiae bacterium]|nr:discoidin domain-containing protein [Verrucomicrobiae bacterium]